MEADEIKICCALLYSNDWVRLLVGESLHPGGVELTRRTGELLALGEGRKLLDVACGPGTSAICLAETFGCDVTGVDFSKQSIAAAEHAAEARGVSNRARFLLGDAEHLPLPDTSFDAVICECSLCTFPDKPAAVREIFRVLRPGGRFGLSDLVRTGPIPPELQSLSAWVACIADARPLAEHRSLLDECGFQVELAERHDELLETMVDSIRRRLVAAQLASGLGKLELPGLDLDSAAVMARSAAGAVKDGRLGYALVIATKPSTPESTTACT